MQIRDGEHWLENRKMCSLPDETTGCRKPTADTAQLHLHPNSAWILVEEAVAVARTLQDKALSSRIPQCLHGSHCSDASEGEAALWHSKAMQGILTCAKPPKVSIQTKAFAKSKAQNHVHVDDIHHRICRNYTQIGLLLIRSYMRT